MKGRNPAMGRGDAQDTPTARNARSVLWKALHTVMLTMGEVMNSLVLCFSLECVGQGSSFGINCLFYFSVDLALSGAQTLLKVTCDNNILCAAINTIKPIELKLLGSE